jgi:hypothetical protein
MPQIGDWFYDDKSFSWNDLLGQDKWTTWAPVFGSLTVVGATTYLGRYRVIGRSVEFQVKFSAATSIASVAGADYLNLPIAAVGYAGTAVMTNDTTNVAVGLCHIDVATSRCYLPTQGASGNVFNLCGAYEI